MYLIYQTSDGRIISATSSESQRDAELDRLGSAYAGVTKADFDFSDAAYYDAASNTFSGPTDEDASTEKAMYVRSERDELLRLSDYTQLPDVPFTDSEKSAWQTYRESLRNIPSQPGFPNTITWPTKPS